MHHVSTKVTHLCKCIFLISAIVLAQARKEIFRRTELFSNKVYWFQSSPRWVKPVCSTMFAVKGELLGYRGFQFSLDGVRNDTPYHWQKL